MNRWPRDNQDDLIAFYGEPGPDVERQLVSVSPPFPMTYDGKKIGTIKFHKKAAMALKAALNKVWDYYGRDYAIIDKLDIEHYDGAYCCRKIRGSATKWSNHAYGAAIDIDAAKNGFGTGHGHIPLPVVAAFKSEGFRWGGDYKGRTDPMHFEACNSGEPARTFEEWLAFYKCPPSFKADDHPVVPLPPKKPPVEPKPDPKPVEPKPAPEAPKPDEDDDSKLPWYKRWAKQIFGTILGGAGLSIGGVTLDATTILAFCALVAVAFVVFLGYVYLIPPRGKLKKGW